MEQLENAFRTPARVAGAFEFSNGGASEEEEEEESAFGDDGLWMCNCRAGLPWRTTPMLRPNANEAHAADAENTELSAARLSFPF